MRFLVWTCRVIMAVVVAAFVATVFYMTHSVGTDMDSAKPVLNLITVIGAALVGLAWPLMRRYWQALILLVTLGVLRGLFGTGPGFSSLKYPLLTPFQCDYLWISIGVVALALVASLVVRAVASDRALRAMKQVPSIGAAAPAAAVAEPVTRPASLVAEDAGFAVAPAEAPAASEDSTVATEPADKK
jgi:hypothetical protein